MRTMIVFATLALLTALAPATARAQSAAPVPPPPLQTAPPPPPPAYGYPPPNAYPPPGYPPGAYPPPQYPPGYGYPPPAWAQPQLVPPLRYESKPTYALIFSGVGVFSLGYIMDIFGTLVTSHQPAWECALPVVGPWMQIGDSFTSDWRDLAKAFYVTDALIQTAGLVLTVTGASIWRKVPVRIARGGFAVTF